MAAKIEGEDPQAEKKAKRAAATVGELCDIYLEDAEAGRLLTRRGIAKKASTLATDRSRVETHIPRVRRDMAATALPGRSPLALPSDATPLGRLMLARLALKVEAQRIALDRTKGRLMDVSVADQHLVAIAGAMRDAVLNWPARVAGTIAAEIHADPHLVQTLLQEQMHALLSDVAARLDGQPAA